jgi:hypothetical protein
MKVYMEKVVCKELSRELEKRTEFVHNHTTVGGMEWLRRSFGLDPFLARV